MKSANPNPFERIGKQAKRTAVERPEFVACKLGGMHPLEEGGDAGVIFAPEVVGNYRYS